MNHLKKDKLCDNDSRLTIGNILYDVNEKIIPGEELFVVVGKSYSDVALARLFEQKEITPELEKKCYRLNQKVTFLHENSKIKEPLYADLSRIIIRECTVLLALLDKFPDRLTGVIHQLDSGKITEELLNANTISQQIKNTYFK